MKRLLALVCSILLVSPGSFAADAPALCGTQRVNLREQLHLHRQSMRSIERTRLLRTRTTTERTEFSSDYGNIAVMDSSGGVVASQNPFNLEGRALRFQNEGGGYRLTGAPSGYSQSEAASGEPFVLGDDDARAVLLGFSVPFYGIPYDHVWVHSDGTLTFGEPDSATAARSMGRLAGGPPRIAVLFADLDPSIDPNSVRVFRGQDYVTVTWLDTPQYSSSGFGPKQRVQARLYASGAVELMYDQVTLSDAVVGLSPGRLSRPIDVVALGESASGVLFPNGVAERFGASENIDIVRVSQRFFETHEDAYDYLVVFNTMGLTVAPGALANMTPVRTRVRGIGDELIDAGLEFGSPRRLQAVLNMGPASLYPADPYLLVGFRGRITGDNTMTLLGHETGHLFLALASVRVGDSRPMLGSQNSHWSFNFNSEASLLEGNRIADRGPDAEFRYLTTGTVEGYSPLDQYLMGLRPPEDVPPMFAVLDSRYAGGGAIPPAKLPENGILFQGSRLDIPIEDLIAAEGPRVPDHTVAQSRFRFAFILVTAEGTEPSAEAIEQLETYRNQFEPYFNRVSDGRSWADTSLRQMLKVSAWPALGLAAGQQVDVNIEIARPLDYDLLIGLHTTHGHIEAPTPVILRAGQTRLTAAVKGLSPGVSDLVAEAWNGPFEPVFTRIAVQPSLASLTLIKHYTDGPVVLRVSDSNELRYPGVRIKVTASGAVRFVDGYNQDFATGSDGLMWLWWDDAGPGSTFEAEIEGAPDSRILIERK